MRKYILLLATILYTTILFSQEQAFFQHYSVGNGLSQNTVMAIMQDSKGFMWFGTWDGLNKFDGYEFTIYKSRPGDHSNIATSRIDFLHEDKLGFIWLQTYDGKFHRFDPRTEQFYSLPLKTDRFSYAVDREKRFIETRAGEIWIATNDIGTIRLKTDPKTFEVSIKEYSIASGHLSKSNHVNFIFEDKETNIWIGTEKEVYCAYANTNKPKVYHPNKANTELGFSTILESENRLWLGDEEGTIWEFSKSKNTFKPIHLANNTEITRIAFLNSDNLIITTDKAGFFIYSQKNVRIQAFNKDNNLLIKTSNFNSVKVDSHGVAWLEADQLGVFRYRLSDNSLKHFQPKIDDVNRISVLPNFMLIEDVVGRLWINPQGGGFSRYNRERDELEYFYNEPGALSSKFSNIIHAAFVDKQGNLWSCTYNKGLERISFRAVQFNLNKVNKRDNTITSNEIRALCQTSDGIIIMATKDGTIRLHNSQMKELGILSENGSLTGSKLNDLAYCILEDSKKNIWIGTKGKGVIKLTPQSGGSIPNYKLERFLNNPSDKYSLSNNNIYSIIESSSSQIIIGTFGGGINILQEKDGVSSFINCQNELKSYPIGSCAKVRHLLEDKSGVLWVATSNGLLQIDNLLTPKMKMYYIEKESNNTKSLSNNDVHYLHLDRKNQLWIGTFGGGLLKLTAKATDTSSAIFENYTTKNGLYNDIVLSILEDKNGNLWLSSENSISRFEADHHFVQNFALFDGVDGAHFSEAACLYLEDGKMFFGTNKGYYTFYPDKIKPSKEVPPIEFTRFQLFNTDVKVGEENSPLKENIDYVDEVELAHSQSVFGIEYAALDFTNSEKIQYAFILEGFEKDWNYVQHQRKATYTNLSKGTYTFKVRSTNSEGVWVDNERVLIIKVLPAFWETPWAYLMYFLLLCLALYVVFHITRKFSRLKNNVEIEQKVTDIKLRFFTNISHELRTPLSLIIGPVENILKSEKVSSNAKEQLEIVHNNAERMLRLINQILDFRKIQNKKMRLKIQNTRFDSFVKDICSNFSKAALDRNIDFKFNNQAGEVYLWVDRDKADIIIYNLLSNAFKYTPNNKKIEVNLSVNSFAKSVQLKVIDEGVGIPMEKHSFLFERFTSANEIKNLGMQPGTGIGLNLVKELLDLHKATVEVESEVNRGSTFTLTFRYGKEHFGNEADFIIEDDIPEDEATVKLQIDVAETQITLKDSPSLLIVDDNDEMRIFLSKIFEKKYRVSTASDGKIGLEIATDIIPDLIISDLMMPNMDGLQLTELLKNDEKTCHIPIILLTAKTAIESRLEAMHCGADDYITKPFSPVYIEARVENMLEQRKRIQERFRKHIFDLQPAEVEMVSQDEVFLSKLLGVMEKHIGNSELTVDDLVSEMGYGRTVFFNKLKGLTGLAPIEFIRELRIKRAAQLLLSGEYNVSEITYMVGMSDSRYFSKCFKKVYGVTPSEYKKKSE